MPSCAMRVVPLCQTCQEGNLQNLDHPMTLLEMCHGTSDTWKIPTSCPNNGYVHSLPRTFSLSSYFLRIDRRMTTIHYLDVLV